MPTLTFLGAAGTVTGSKHLLDLGRHRVLVDCGLFQGLKELRERNWRPLPLAATSVDALILTHAHLDHCGYLPRLVAQGFRGRVFCTPGTRDLCSLVLPDSANLQEEQARDANKHEYSKHHPALPLYTEADAARALTLLQPVGYNRPIPIVPGVEVEFIDAGHLLGSAYARVRLDEGGTILFGGDLGRYGRPILHDPSPVERADVLLVESTYGNRNHKNLAQTIDEFAYALNDTLASRRGNVVIPAFAVGRTQDMLYFIVELARQGRLGPMDVYVDSPMASAATRITLAHPELYDRGTARLAEWLKRGKGGPRVRFTEDVEDSMKINSVRSGAVILSASGMCDGGRIKHHLRFNLSRPECAIVFVGFQAAGTLGRRIVDGAKRVRLFGEEVAVRAKVFTIGGLSAHADQAALVGWLKGFRAAPRQTWVVHGEPLSANALRDEIEQRLGWRVAVPDPRQSVEL